MEPSESGAQAATDRASRVRQDERDQSGETTKALLLTAVFAASCSGGASTSRQLANPASEHRLALGGRSVIETAASGQHGVCVFADNRQCEEWTLLRGACPVGGIKVTGYGAPQARYCTIRGGDYVVTKEQTATTPEQGTCTLPGALPCAALAVYEGLLPLIARQGPMPTRSSHAPSGQIVLARKIESFSRCWTVAQIRTDIFIEIRPPEAAFL